MKLSEIQGAEIFAVMFWTLLGAVFVAVIASLIMLLILASRQPTARTTYVCQTCGTRLQLGWAAVDGEIIESFSHADAGLHTKHAPVPLRRGEMLPGESLSFDQAIGGER